jgi:hypothetical protein
MGTPAVPVTSMTKTPDCGGANGNAVVAVARYSTPLSGSFTTVIARAQIGASVVPAGTVRGRSQP